MSESEAPVLLEVDGPLATLTLNRPKALNAFDVPTVELLAGHLERLGEDPAVRVVMLTGVGRAFSAGGDLRAIHQATGGGVAEGLKGLAGIFHRSVLAIRSMSKPVLAVLNGVTAGGGFSLALACDLRIMAASAFMQQAYTSNGLCPDGGGTWTLPRLVGMAKALELVMLDPRLPSAECLRLGLCSEVIPDPVLRERAREIALALAAKPAGALGRTKALLAAAERTDLAEQLRQEELAIAAQAAGPEGQEGMAAFLEKRPPQFA